jgi:hypothetical protein
LDESVGLSEEAQELALGGCIISPATTKDGNPSKESEHIDETNRQRVGQTEPGEAGVRYFCAVRNDHKVGLYMLISPLAQAANSGWEFIGKLSRKGYQNTNIGSAMKNAHFGK